MFKLFVTPCSPVCDFSCISSDINRIVIGDKHFGQVSLFHRAFFNSIMDKTQTHALFYSTLYLSSVLISLKYIKIFNGTPTCFDLKRSSSGSMSVPC